MRYLSFYKPGFDNDAPPPNVDFAGMGALIEEMTAAGILIATDGLQSSRKGLKVQVDEAGDFVVTDGPFAEAKEVIGGYAILEAQSKEHVIELTKRFLAVMGSGQCEVRLMADAGSENCLDGEIAMGEAAGGVLSQGN